MPKSAAVMAKQDITIMNKCRDYYDITKPRVVALLVLTAVVGMSLAVPGGLPWQLFIPAMLGIGLLSSAAAAINHNVDEKIDENSDYIYYLKKEVYRLDQYGRR